MLETFTTVEEPDSEGGFTEAELARIEAMLGEGASSTMIWRALDMPMSTFYYRLKKSGKRIGSPVRRLVDAEGLTV